MIDLYLIEQPENHYNRNTNKLKLLEYRKNPSIELRNDIVEHNLNIIPFILNKSFNNQKFEELLKLIAYDYNDVYQESVFAIMAAVESFDIKYIDQISFSTYVASSIYNRILRFYTISKKPDKFNYISFDQEIPNVDSEEMSIESALSYSIYKNDEIEIKTNEMINENLKKVFKYLDTINNTRNRIILKLFIQHQIYLSYSNKKVYEDNAKWTLQEIGDLFGVSRERIRQVLVKEFDKMIDNLKLDMTI